MEFTLGEQLAEGRVIVAVSKDRAGVFIKVGDFAITLDRDEFEDFVSACNALRAKLSL